MESSFHNIPATDLKKGILDNELLKLDALAHKYYNNGNFFDCISYLRESYEIRKETLGDDEEETLQNLSNLASALARVGNFIEAESMFKQVLDRKSKTLGPEHYSSLQTRKLPTFL
jgi:tetratricopeptide (TPR) repeat protein